MRLKKLCLAWSHMGSMARGLGSLSPSFLPYSTDNTHSLPFQSCCASSSGIQCKHAGIAPCDNLFCSPLEQRDYSLLLSHRIKMLKKIREECERGKKMQVTALSALGIFCLLCCQWSWGTIGHNLKHFPMCFYLIYRQDCGKNAITKERTWLSRKLDRWASKTLLYWIYVM